MNSQQRRKDKRQKKFIVEQALRMLNEIADDAAAGKLTQEDFILDVRMASIEFKVMMK